MKINFLLILVLIISLSNSNQSSKCAEETIDHCTQCGTGENSDSCSTCENNYFQFFNNLLCLSCNDPTYGQIGCEGNCNNTYFRKNLQPFCEKCKEGYFYINGNCTSCSKVFQGCSKCDYERNQDKENFTCIKCLNNEYTLTDEGFCEKCSFPNCDKCHYNNGTVECDKCNEGYYKNSAGDCLECYYHNIEGGYCKVCSDNDNNIDYDNCNCDYGYTKLENGSCFKCQENCDECEYNYILNTTECIECSYSNYILNSFKNCTYCGFGCNECELNIENNPICKRCDHDFFLDKNQCKKCPEGCNKCEDESICIECKYDYILNAETNNCTLCSELAGEGCQYCIYNQNNKQYECLECEYWGDSNYVYINNTHQCLKITGENNYNLNDCLKANKEKDDKYECYECRYDLIKVKNENKCIELFEVNLSPYCLEVEKLNKSDAPFYSCTKCEENYYLKIDDSTGIQNCVNKNEDDSEYVKDPLNFPYCLETKKGNENSVICTKCVKNAILKDNICKCDSSYFGYKNLSCFKCDDEKYGNPGCNATFGCQYFPLINELDCNKCKEGYFEYTKGQCFSCSEHITNCNQCNLNDKEELKCEKCMDLYILNDKTNACELNECEEYPDISPGCIICKDKLNEYKEKKECQTCKYGYFLTKEKKCVYCRSEEYGGPDCFECGYAQENGKETDKIICKNCYSYYDDNQIDLFNFLNNYHSTLIQYYSTALSSDGKCYNCQYEVSDNCLKCEFINDKENKEKLTCTLCPLGYYLNSEGKCISFIKDIKTIPNCESMVFNIENYVFYYQPKNDKPIIIDYYYYYNDLSHYNEAMKKIELPINTICKKCNSGYILNNKGECETFDLRNCTGNSLLNKNNLGDCINLCNDNEFPLINLLLENNSMNYNEKDYKNINKNDNLKMLYSFLYANITNKEIKNFSLQNPICLNISDKNLTDKYSLCENVIYNPTISSFECYKCKYSNYNFDPNKKICVLKDEDSLVKCYRKDETLVTYENEIKTCISNEKALDNCLTANASSKYIKNLYNCTSCKKGSILYYSKFYGRYMCHNIFEKIIKSKNIELEEFNNEENITIGKNGICQKNYFTPDGKNCYKCDNENVGMSGCKGDCSFSDKRENTILCLDGCKKGYIESSPNICEACDSINEGCSQCHYDSYPENYSHFKRERRFVCDYCRDGYIKSPYGDGQCISYKEEGCEQIELNETTLDYNCKSCKKHYILKNYDNHKLCRPCIITSAIINNKCIACDDEDKGGKKNCEYCQENEKGDGVICKQCKDDYILFSGNNTCLERNNNVELKQFKNCLELDLNKENNKLICSRCIKEFSLIKIGSGTKTEFKCIYTPTLYDPNFKFYYYDKIIEPLFYSYEKNKLDFLKTDYLFRQTQFLPCKEAINLGTGNNYLYSCNKCYNIFENEEYDYYYYNYQFYEDNNFDYYFYIDYLIEDNEGYISDSFPIKIDDKSTKSSYCMKAKKEIENCVEATYKISNGKEIYNCTKCLNGYDLLYNRKLNINYCRKCLVDNCQTCANDDPHKCLNCTSPNYILNNYTGLCVFETKNEPVITWKDLYSFILKDSREINGQIINGPSFKLRGITTNQISAGHSFWVHLIFKLRHYLRNLEELIIPAICQIKENVEETNDKINIIDYDCIGNTTVDDNYQLYGIKEDNFTNVINNPKNNFSNFKDDNILLLFDLKNYEELNKNIYNITIIDFPLSGDIKNNISEKEIKNYSNIEMELKEVEDMAKCDFIKYEKNKANFTCILEINSNISSANLTFKNNEINLDDNVYLIIKSLDKVKLRIELEPEIIYDLPPESSVKKEEKKSYKTLIIIAIIVGAVFLIGIAIVIIFACKSGSKGKIYDSDVNEISKDNSNNFASQNNINEV